MPPQRSLCGRSRPRVVSCPSLLKDSRGVSGVTGLDFTLFKGILGSLAWTGNYYYTTKFNWDPSGQFPEPAYGLIASSLNWTSPSGMYEGQLWCSNCGNTCYDTFIAESGPERQKTPADPRLFGLRLTVHFK